MEIRIGKYVLRSDRYCMWIDAEYETKDKNGKPSGKFATKKVAGYTTSWEMLLRDFVAVQHRDNDAKTVKELLKVLKKVAEDTEAIKKTALKEDFKVIRQIGKEIDKNGQHI